MAAALWHSQRVERLDILAEVSNPGLVSCATTVEVGDSANPARVLEHARKYRPDFAVIGPEEPLAAGIVDELAEIGVPAVGPMKALAMIETSKSFARELIARHGIGGNPEHRIFRNSDGLRDYLGQLGSFVVKPDGLTGGKGVRVSGDHLHSIGDGEEYCREILAGGGVAIVEEKLDGEEFSLQSFCDGDTVVDMIPVQDHKRLLDGDAGPNTGGMGSYTCADHLLPFLSKDDLALASRINRAVAKALKKETGFPYKGILYGGFMLTARGLRVIEYNARFGDPEALNVLPLLENDFLDICKAIVFGTLDKIDVRFARKATVCKYVVPTGYPAAIGKRVPISVPLADSDSLRIYHGAVQEDDGALMLTGSRAIGIVGIGDSLGDAERIAEDAASRIDGPVFHRRDIGTQSLVQSRIDHMIQIRSDADSLAEVERTGERAWARAI
jgi:phosphoribosylamine--glycine ligase